VDIFQAVILGIVEGLTEFLPISSTGHMIVVGDFIGVAQTEANKAFEVIIQLAAILAVVFNYKDKFTLSKIDLWLKVLIAFLPLAIVGFIFKDLIKEAFNPKVVAYMFIIGGIIFLIQEHFYKKERQKTRDVEDVSFTQAAWIGFAQMFALIPGTSRAGSTIVGALLVGLDRKAAAEFSFLLALPVMGATSGYDLLKHYDEFSQTGFLPLIIGFVVAFVVAYFTMKFFIKFLERFTFRAFGIYRIIFGILLLAVYL
jgi:undecaprenyl-diphosphatase